MTRQYALARRAGTYACAIFASSSNLPLRRKGDPLLVAQQACAGIVTTLQKGVNLDDARRTSPESRELGPRQRQCVYAEECGPSRHRCAASFIHFFLHHCASRGRLVPAESTQRIVKRKASSLAEEMLRRLVLLSFSANSFACAWRRHAGAWPPWKRLTASATRPLVGSEKRDTPRLRRRSPMLPPFVRLSLVAAVRCGSLAGEVASEAKQSREMTASSWSH